MIIKLQKEIHSRQSFLNLFSLILIIYLQQYNLKNLQPIFFKIMYIDYI